MDASCSQRYGRWMNTLALGLVLLLVSVPVVLAGLLADTVAPGMVGLWVAAVGLVGVSAGLVLTGWGLVRR